MEQLVGFILPPIISVINQKITDNTVRFIVSMLVSVIVAILFNYSKLQFMSVDQVLGSIALVFTESQIAYRTYWHEDSPTRKMLGI